MKNFSELNSLEEVSFGEILAAQELFGEEDREEVYQKQTNNDIVSARKSLRQGINRIGEDFSEWRPNEKQYERPLESRKSKKAPRIQASNIQVSRRREILPVGTGGARDPRFDAISCKTSIEVSKKNYAFLNDIREAEIKELSDQITRLEKPRSKLERQMQKLVSPQRLECMKKDLTRLQDKHRNILEQQRIDQVSKEFVQREKSLVKAGVKQRVYYPKKGEIKRLALERKYHEITPHQRSKSISRKRKKLSAKEKKALPRTATPPR